MLILQMLVAASLIASGTMGCDQGGVTDVSEDCSDEKNKPGHYCSRSQSDSSRIVCCNFKSMDSLAKAFNSSRRTFKEDLNPLDVYVVNSSLDHVNAGSEIWHNVRSLRFKDSAVERISGEFRGKLSCVQMSGLHLQNVENLTFSALNLTRLDLSNNNLTFVPVLNRDSGHQDRLTVDFSNNGNISCSHFNSLIDKFHDRVNFTSVNATVCLNVSHHGWFNSPTLVPLNEIIMIKQLERDCPKGDGYECSCSNYNVDTGGKTGDVVTLVGKVNCSGQNMTKLPPKLPPRANILDVSNNRITSIDILAAEETYRGVRKFYADNNLISSIDGLEGSHFIKHFVVLSLRNNTLTSIPTYFLTHAFNSESSIQRTLQLGQNEFACDCNNANDLKDFVQQNLASIKDNEDVKCSNSQQIKYLDLGELCDAKDWSEYLPAVIAIEVVLLFVLISKVTYDYWVFKTKGYLPWPASKMPKLPCDWVCETL